MTAAIVVVLWQDKTYIHKLNSRVKSAWKVDNDLTERACPPACYVTSLIMIASVIPSNCGVGGGGVKSEKSKGAKLSERATT